MKKQTINHKQQKQELNISSLKVSFCFIQFL